MTESYPDVVNAWALALQATTARPSEFLLYALADNTAEAAKQVEVDLKAAKPGEFVAVDVRFTNMMDTTTLHVQPHLWGVWCVMERTIPAAEMFAGSPAVQQ
ncbi:MAG: hypothetical protein K2Y33_20565 [Mycolicibacterium frederiksbergense]|uniref:hypothetical protein n=1 Tax=Mycobacterium adipatum TaxID=1682113 RepID=UPI0027EC01B7|nr:hypothetical protein [Mycolicibacterium frederiksbergense]